MFNLRHIGICVQNLDLMKNFFIDNFNCSIKIEQIEKGKFIDDLQGRSNVVVTTCKLMLDKNPSNIIELLCYEDKNIKKNPILFNSKGINHYAITVKNIDTFYSKMIKKNFKFTTKPIISNDKKAKCTFMYDVEDNLIELVEEL
jgi:hypothetical protein